MTMPQMGGDSQNTMPIAINAGLSARQIAKLVPVDPNAAKFSMDAFRTTVADPRALLEATGKNLPLSEALAQQSLVTRLAAKIPFVRNFLGPDFILNEAIGGLGKEALGGLSKAQVTKIAMEGGDIAAKLAQSGMPREAAELVARKSAERLAATGGQLAGSVGQQLLGSVDDLAKEAVGMTMKKGFKSVTEEAVKKALASPDPYKALNGLGFYAKDAKALVNKALGSSAEAVAKTATSEAAQAAGKAATQEASKGGIKGFFGKLLSGAKGNFIVAGVFSLGSNAIQLAQGKIGVKQFLGLTALDTAAYGAIGWGSAAAGAAIGTALFPGVGSIAGFAIGLGIGFVGGAVYEKVLRNPVKAALGGGGAQQSGYNPSQYNGAPDGKAPVSPSGYPVTPPTPGVDLTYEEAMRAIDRLSSGR
jgi:hypothetical protein